MGTSSSRPFGPPAMRVGIGGPSGARACFGGVTATARPGYAAQDPPRNAVATSTHDRQKGDREPDATSAVGAAGGAAAGAEAAFQ